jgi:hypothetical protein
VNRIAVRSILVMLFAPLTLGAQSTSSPPAGSKVRFWIVAGGSVHTAQLERLTPDSLILQSCATCTTLRYARTEVNHIEVFRALPSGMRTLSGYGYGSLIGLVAGVIAASTCRKLGDGCDGAILLVPAGAILGGLIGAIAGYLGSYTWDPVVTPSPAVSSPAS